MKDPIIVYTVVSEPSDAGWRTERMGLRPDLPTCETDNRTGVDRRPYRIVYREINATLGFEAGPWYSSCLGVDFPGGMRDDRSTEAALAWLLEGEEK